jgi:hypothetical protein
MPEHINSKISCLLVILIVIIFVLFEIPAFGMVKDWQMEFSNNELAADIENAPLGVVLEEIHKRAEVEFFLNKDQSDRVITVKFGFLPLERALARILKNLSYAILYGADDRILRVMIFGTNKTSPMRYTEAVADDQFLGRKMSTETLSELGTEDQVSAGDHEIIVEPTSAASEMTIDPPSGEEMEIASPSDADMIAIDPPSGEEMEITSPSDADIIIIESPGGEGIEITSSSTTTINDPQSKGD